MVKGQFQEWCNQKKSTKSKDRYRVSMRTSSNASDL